MSTFQEKFNNWSNLTLGNVHLIHSMTKTRKYVLIKNQTIPGRIGPWYPPRKNVVAMAHTIKIFVYSARKKRANLIQEYSV